MAATAGRGADAVIDAVATDSSLTDAINIVRPGAPSRWSVCTI